MKYIKLFEQFITEDKMYDIASEVYDIVDYKDLGNKNKIKSALKKLGYKTDPLMVGVVMRKIQSELNERNYSSDERMELADKGQALPDGSFPIVDLEDLKNAIRAYGRAKDQSAAAKFIAKRAKALGAEDLIPDTEDFQKSLNESIMTIIDNDRTHRNTIDLGISFEANDESLANKAAKEINDFAAKSQDIKKLQKDNSASISTMKSPEESYADPGEWYFSWSIIFAIRDDKDIDIANKIVNEISDIAKKLKIKVKVQDNIFSKKGT